jgi:hypothetical protein
MPALKRTSITARVLWIGRVTDQDENLRSEALEAAELRFSGIEGECHGGLTRPSCTRVRDLYPKGTEIRNTRQLSIVSQEEMDAIAADMKLARLLPEWLGASMVIEGIPDFTHVPPGSRLLASGGASLCIDLENRPCVLPGREIDRDHPGIGARFRHAARNRRGVTAWVEREGRLTLGDRLTLFIPDQPVWPHLAAARG